MGAACSDAHSGAVLNAASGYRKQRLFVQDPARQDLEYTLPSQTDSHIACARGGATGVRVSGSAAVAHGFRAASAGPVGAVSHRLQRRPSEEHASEGSWVHRTFRAAARSLVVPWKRSPTVTAARCARVSNAPVHAAMHMDRLGPGSSAELAGLERTRAR